jgi:hypothetical protein
MGCMGRISHTNLKNCMVFSGIATSKNHTAAAPPPPPPVRTPRSRLHRGFLYEGKSGISQIYYVNSRIRLGRFQKSSSNCYVLFICAKLHFLVQNRRLAFFFLKNCMANPMRNFQLPCFPHNFATKKNDCRDLEMGCIDASRRQLQSVLKIGF